MEAALRNLLYDNPELYEEIYDGADYATPQMCEQLFDDAPRTLLDIGCGTGRDLEYFAGAGLRCVGVDLQERMIAWARTRRPGIEFHVGDIRTVRLARTFDVITCLGWALANLHATQDLTQSMATFAAHSAPGTLLFLHLPNFIGDLEGNGMRHRFTIDTPAFQATAEATYTLDRRKQLLVRRRTWSIPGRPVQEDFVRFRMLFPMELEHYLTSHGFSVLGMYDNTALAASNLSGSDLYVAARFES